MRRCEQLANNPFTPRLVDIFSERGDEVRQRTFRPLRRAPHVPTMFQNVLTKRCTLPIACPETFIYLQTLTFDEFVDIFSVFSSRAPKEEKIKVAFRMYDFDDNGFIDPIDLEMVIETMLRLAADDDKERLSEEERICIIQKVITEGDPSVTEEDQQKHGWQNVGQISCHEFER